MLASPLRLCLPSGMKQSRGLFCLFSIRNCPSSSMAPVFCLQRYEVQVPTLISQHHKVALTRLQTMASPCRQFRSSSHPSQAAPPQSSPQNELLVSQMNIRLVNENSFLSWCRNAYLSTVVGVAMMAEGASALAQSAGLGALLVGTMNLAWGTGCHVSNLVRLRHVSGMSGMTLFLHLAGSSLHCLLWGFVLVCYIGFLDETRWPTEEGEEEDVGGEGRGKKVALRDGLRRV